MEAKLIELGVETYKITLELSMPILVVTLVVGLLISVFQATTSIQEMTLTFVPKVIAVVALLILLMPWMIQKMSDFTIHIFNLIPTFIF